MLPSTKICFLIDDDVDDQEIFALALQQIGDQFECQTADDGYLGLQQLMEKTNKLPDFIFLDLNMPRMNGKECLSEIKKQSHLKHIPVIIYSTSSLPNDIIQTQKLGAAAFITKPFSIPELSSKLEEVFQSLQVSTYPTAFITR